MTVRERTEKTMRRNHYGDEQLATTTSATPTDLLFQFRRFDMSRARNRRSLDTLTTRLLHLANERALPACRVQGWPLPIITDIRP